jgi:release factor glutamine methyltransferase
VPETSSLEIREAFRTGIKRLRDANVSSYTLEAELLLLHILQKDRTYLYAHPEELITPQQLEKYFSLLARRAAGEPTQHLTGKQEFWGLEFEVNPDVLIPRPETEHVVEVALDRLALRELRAGRPQMTDGAGFLIADIGTGSGCLAVALAKQLSAAQFYATDISTTALKVARRNAHRHAVENRIHFVEADLSHPLRADITPRPSPARDVSGRSRPNSELAAAFDLVVSNPPYIPRRDATTLSREVRDHEPAVALFGGEEGYELYAGLIALAAHHLKPGGIFVAELGHDSLPAVQPLLDAHSWKAVGVANDLAGIPRVIAAERADTT